MYVLSLNNRKLEERPVISRSRNFVNFPGTRLGKLARATTREEILSLCDKYWPGETPEFFFDVSWVGFNSILDVYRRGNLHLSHQVCALVTKKVGH